MTACKVDNPFKEFTRQENRASDSLFILVIKYRVKSQTCIVKHNITIL